ncbi:MAG: hypothetical protein ACYC9Z_13870 [Casimicrobiaceae bacterium]
MDFLSQGSYALAMNPADPKATTDIPGQTFAKFLEQLKVEGISVDVIDRLRSTIIENGTLTEGAIRAALFGDNHEK